LLLLLLLILLLLTLLTLLLTLITPFLVIILLGVACALLDGLDSGCKNCVMVILLSEGFGFLDFDDDFDEGFDDDFDEADAPPCDNIEANDDIANGTLTLTV